MLGATSVQSALITCARICRPQCLVSTYPVVDRICSTQVRRFVIANRYFLLILKTALVFRCRRSRSSMSKSCGTWFKRLHQSFAGRCKIPHSTAKPQTFIFKSLLRHSHRCVSQPYICTKPTLPRYFWSHDGRNV